MINEEKVKLMTHMAVYEKREGKEYAPAVSYEKKDYVSFKKVTGFFMSTLAYVLIYGIFVSLSLMLFASTVKASLVIVLLVLGIALYVVHSFYYVRWVSLKASQEYDKGAEKLEALISDYEKLEEINKG